MGQATSFSDLLDLLVLEVPGCPTALLTQQLQQATRKFCEESEAWREKLAAISLVAEDVTYTLTPTYTCEIRRILEVWIRTADDVTNGNDGTLQGYDKYTFDPLTKVLTLDDSIEPQESITGGLVVKVALVPYLKTDVHTALIAGGVTAAFLNLWAEPIMAYAKWSLMRMPGKAWTNPQLAVMHLADYRDGVTRAKIEADGLTYRHDQDGFGA